jgi:Holliday junction DNA helicase RuvA
MLHALTGLITSTRKQVITLLAGPVALDVTVPDETLFPVGQKQTVFLYLHWNQEQGPSLYGFQKELDKTIFLMIISCSGLGPRIGLAVLAGLGAQGFLEAIYAGNEKLLSKVNGIGAKKAEQIIVHLKHKVNQLVQSGVSLDVSTDHTHWNTAMEALAALSYSRSEITLAVNFVRHNTAGSGVEFDQIMRQALSFLSKQQ